MHVSTLAIALRRSDRAFAAYGFAVAIAAVSLVRRLSLQASPSGRTIIALAVLLGRALRRPACASSHPLAAQC